MTDETQTSDERATDASDAVESSPTLRLQVGLDPRAFVGCRVEELFVFHDRAFVESAFAAALGRAPDETELQTTLADLRAGRRDKREIVADLCASAEGARVGARERVSGVGARDWKQRARRLPLVGYLWQLVASVARLPTALRHQREFETFALAQQQLIADFVNDQQRRFDEQRRQLGASFDVRLQLVRRRLDEVSDESAHAIADFRLAVTDAHEAVSMLCDAVATLDARQAEERAHLEARLEELRRRLDAQEEFSIQEQRAIVEAQKAVLAEIEERAAEADAERRRALEELSRRVASLFDALEEAGAQVSNEA